ncbi:Thioredoxin-like protein 1 [Lamellibrachia satsuma]|nr:Thioredoxin-like protein 1 [Lamellibrachia satsuma]
MTGLVKVIETDAQFQPELIAAGTKLAVVDCFATWCGPCQRIAPVYEQLATKYPRAVFLKVDVDKCPDSAASNGVTAMPTFLFFRNKIKVDTMRGADPTALEEKVKKWYGEGEEEGDTDVGVKGSYGFVNIDEQVPKGGYLESDCDEQLIIAVEFNQAVKIHSLKIYGPDDKGAKTVKVFLNQPQTLSFDQAEGMAAVQDLVLTPEDLKSGALVPLRFVKFQNVQNITLFVKDNMTGAETTQIDYLGFIGSPVNTTNMAEFKRVAGKKGESHY